MRHVPDIPVTRIDFFFGGSDRDPVGLSVCNRVLAASNVPLTPRRDDRKIRREGGVGQLEANLVVSFASATMGKRVGADLARDLDLTPGNERPRHRGAEEILTTVDSASAEGGPHELFHEFLA